MDREERRQRLAELHAADQVKRAAAEPEIVRKEALLAAARSKLADLQAEQDRVEAELDDALRAPPGQDDPPRG